MVKEQLLAGYKAVTWDGKDEHDRTVTSGIYLYRLKAGDIVETKKMMLLKENVFLEQVIHQMMCNLLCNYMFMRTFIFSGLLVIGLYFTVSATNFNSIDSMAFHTGVKKPLYDIEPSPVHQWIALQAYKKLSYFSELKDEIKDYLPTDDNSSYYSGDYQGNSFVSPNGWWDNEDEPYNQSTALIEGVWEEDKGEFFPGTELPLRSVVHFWDPDGDYDAGLDLSFLGYGVMSSALEAAQARFYQAVAHYNIGEKTKAYYWLGRTAHLLMDITVPAHAQLDPHLIYLNDADNYEAFTGSWEFHYKHITSESPLTTLPSYPYTEYPRYTPPSFNENLTNLFYSLANNTDQFDCDDVDGDSDTYGNGKYRRANNQIDANKIFDKAYKINMFGQETRLLSNPTDYFIINCSWSHDASIIYSETFYNEINNTLYGVKVYYTDGSSDKFYNLIENKVPWAVCGELFQPVLQAHAIGYTAALYELFWLVVNPELVIEEIESPELPVDYALKQNYPNPFNPDTRIEFMLSRSAFVTLEIFNVLGKKVRTLVKEQLSAGYKAVTWDGKDEHDRTVTSGIYLYRFKAGEFVETKKMMLLK